MNAEYSLQSRGYYKRAAFVDAGNIWLFNNDPLRPGGDFQFDTFWSQIAVGTGVGLRFDISLFVICLIWLFQSGNRGWNRDDRWVFDQIHFDSAEWRKENWF
jgi:hypothetical protein